ncbi:hypothetical protein [Enterobacter phage 01_vB_Eclo_IJM]|nr:hypothetical protein [Enterobacter phage 01_vB_Eclo_IJM]
MSFWTKSSMSPSHSSRTSSLPIGLFQSDQRPPPQ